MVNLNNNNMPIKILYVEDDEVIRKSISRVLEPMVKKIYQASNGKQALNIIQQKKIDLVITDIRMPNMDGLSLIKKIKELKLNVPVIITTAFDEVEYLKQAIELHVDKFICKPINMYNLIDNVKSMAQTIIEQREIIKKRLQLENYKKAIRLTNFVIDIDETGKILDTTESLRVYLEENLNEKFNIKNIQEIISSKIIINLMKKVLAYEVFTKEILISLKNENFTFNLTAFASMVNYDNSIKSISIILKDLTHILKEKDKIIHSSTMEYKYYNKYRELIELNFRNLKIVNNYSKLIGVSVKTINTACKKCADISAKQLLINRIILEAKRLLVKGDMKIYQISYYLGFNEPANFSAFFKKHTGMSTNDFKNIIKLKEYK